MGLRNRLKSAIRNTVNLKTINRIELIEFHATETVEALKVATGFDLEHMSSHMDDIVNHRLLKCWVLRLYRGKVEKARFELLFDWEAFELEIKENGKTIEVATADDGSTYVASIETQCSALQRAVKALMSTHKIDEYTWAASVDDNAKMRIGRGDPEKGYNQILTMINAVPLSSEDRTEYQNWKPKNQRYSSVKETPSLGHVLKSA